MLATSNYEENGILAFLKTWQLSTSIEVASVSSYNVICVKSDKLTTGLQFTCQKMPKSFIGFVKKKNLRKILRIWCKFHGCLKPSLRLELSSDPNILLCLPEYQEIIIISQRLLIIADNHFIANKLFLVSWIFLRERFFQLSAQRQGYKTLFTASINVDALIKRPFKCCAF